MSNYTQWPQAIPKYASASNFPISGNNGDIIEALDTHTIYAYDTGTPGWLPVASPAAAIAIDGLTADVSASGPGVVPATVNSVGGSTAANVHSAELAANAATSANTASTIVKRASDGSFSSGALTVSSAISELFDSTISPTSLGSTTITSGTALNVVAQGNYLYGVGGVTAQASLYIWNVLNPASPTLISTTSLTGSGSIPTGGTLIVSGNYAYISTSGTSNLHIVDITDLAVPSITFTGSTGSAISANGCNAIYGQYWYILDQTNANLLTYDITVPSAPVLKSTVAVGSTIPVGSVINGGYLYVACNGGKLVTFSLATPTTPSAVSTTTTGSSVGAIAIRGNYVYLTRAAGGGVETWDISNPASPTQSGSLFSTANTPVTSTVQGRYLYTIGKLNSSNTLTVKVIDVSISATPTLVNTYTSANTGVGGNAVKSIAIAGNLAFLSSTASGNLLLEIIDLKAAELKAALIHSLRTGGVSISQNLDVNGVANVSTALSVGNGGINSRGIINGSNISGTNTGDVTVTDTASIDLTITGQVLSGVVLPAGVDHNSLANLTTGDPHTQYALLAGRTGGQTLKGDTAASGNLSLSSTANATKGLIIVGDGSMLIVESDASYTGIGQPSNEGLPLQVAGTVNSGIAGSISIASSNSDLSAIGPWPPTLYFIPNKGNDFSTSAYLASGDYLGTIGWETPATGVIDNGAGGNIFMQATENHSAIAGGTSLGFSTASNGTVTPVTRLLIDGTGKTLVQGALGVGNASAASVIPVAGLVKKIQIYDASGNSLGFIPVYTAIV